MTTNNNAQNNNTITRIIEKSSLVGASGTFFNQFIFKIILIGDCGIGKTSLINRYIHNTFESDYLCTIGVDFMMKTIELDGIQVKLQIWDTAGMERYKQVTTSYYRGAQAAIVVFDLTDKKSFDNVPKWISCFYEYANPLFQKHLIIVGNKSDMIEERKVTKEDIDNYLKINNFEYMECSAKEGTNTDNMFTNISKKLYDNFKTTNDLRIKNNDIRAPTTILNTNTNFEDILKKNKKEACC